jgi:effector-binding domain-containing protein
MDYSIAIRDLAQQQVISIRERHARAELPTFLGRAFGRLFGDLGLLGVRPAGPPVVIYHQFGLDDVDAEVCVPVGQAVHASGMIQTRVLPAVTVAGTVHVGRYEELGAAYAALQEWITDHEIEAAGPIQERYLSGPGNEVQPARYRTEVEIPIIPQHVGVPGVIFDTVADRTQQPALP